MKIRLSYLRNVITEVVQASEAYMRKERVREDMQARIVDAVIAGDIKDEKDLEEHFKTVDMAAKALRMVPFAVFVKLARMKQK